MPAIRLVLVVLAFAVGGMAAPPSAADWGAVARGPGGAFGWAVDFPTRRAALDAAARSCGGRCVEGLSFSGGCGAIAHGAGGRGGWGTGPSRVEAENNALEACQEQTTGCRVVVWACNSTDD
jgi:serine/threonine-protein kinase